MTLSEEASERLADIVALQPTKNGELQQRWGMDSGSEVHQYLESELGEYYYRDDNSLIRATEEATALVGGETAADENLVQMPELQAAIVDAVADADEEPDSVVAVLHALRERGRDPAVEEVRDGLRRLKDRGIVEEVQKTVPTYRLAAPREDLTVEVI
jgi:hypothetical protein